jgi:SAM-dependent methyltransferase
MDIEKLLELLKKDGRYPEKILDIGCGPCLEGERILDKGISLTGIDQDEETIERVRERLPRGVFIAADAARWLEQADGEKDKYDAVLLRRPDLIFRSENWYQVFRRLPKVIREGGRAVVTTPGESEARLCGKWLSETADAVERSETGIDEEGFVVTAEDFVKNTGEEIDDARASLIRSLSWEDDRPGLVCDVRTGKCTVDFGEEKTRDND